MCHVFSQAKYEVPHIGSPAANLYREKKFDSPAAHGGAVTANGMDLLTEMYVIYVEPYSCPNFIPKFKPLGQLAAAVGSGTHTRKEGRKARKYIRILCSHVEWLTT